LRRFGASVYDALIVVALLAIATFPFIPFLDGKVLVPSEVGALAYFYRVVQGVVVVAFFGYFWTTRGQTIGMLAWRLKLVRADGGPITWRIALVRLGGACVSAAAAGVGYFWIWIDRDRLAWHDRWSGTRVIVLPKR
jgi:uncharacterized RDD family membrane protein YckC